MKVIWTAQNTKHVARHEVSPETVEAVFAAEDAEIVEGEPKGRWIIEGTVRGKLLRVVFTMSGPDEVYPITAHRIRRRKA